MLEDYKVDIENFEGPLDLLLHLIKLNKVDIYDIPISMITKQYLDYINLIESLDLEIAGEFLVIASTLIRIKSKMLLPKTQLDDDDDEWDDPRKELVEKLLEYKKYKELSIHLGEKLEKVENNFARNHTFIENKELTKGIVNFVETDFFSLLAAYKKIMDKVVRRLPSVISGEKWKVEDKSDLIKDRLKFVEFIRFSDTFSTAKSKVEVIVTMMAILELIKIGEIKIQQKTLFDEIYIYKNNED